MSARATSLFLAACLGLLPLSAAAELVGLKDLQGKSASLPHSVPITVAVGVEDLLTGSDVEKKRLTQFINVKGVTFTYMADRETPKTATQTTAGPWSFEIAPLKPLSKIRMEFRLDAAPNIELVTAEILDSPEFKAAATRFLQDASGSRAGDPEFNRAFDSLWKEVGELTKRRIPNVLLRPDAFDNPVIDYARWQPLMALATNVQDLERSNIRAATIPELLKKLTPEQLRTLGGSAKTVADQFVGNFNQVSALLAQYLQPSFVAKYEAHVSVDPSQTQVDDLLRYAGIDVGLIHIPSREELRKAMLVNVYFGGIDNTPFEFKDDLWKFMRQRVSIAFGYDLGDISGNENSDIRGNNAYFLGLGFRLNKYFRLEAGKTIFRSNSTGQLQSGWSWGASIDITGFEVLQGLVTK